jgi:hypothetical protein
MVSGFEKATWGLGLGVWNFRVQGLGLSFGCRVWGLGLSFGCRVWGLGLSFGCRVWGLGYKVLDFRFRV